MKKTLPLFALALTCAALPALAQTGSVTMAGRLDGGLQYIDNSSTKTKRMDSGPVRPPGLSCAATRIWVAA